MALTRIDLEAKASAPKTEEVFIKTLDDTVYLRLPSMAEWRRIHQSHIAGGVTKGEPATMTTMAEAVGACLSDAAGKRLFTREEESNIGDRFQFEVFMEIYEACWRHSLARNAGEEAKKD